MIGKPSLRLLLQKHPIKSATHSPHQCAFLLQAEGAPKGQEQHIQLEAIPTLNRAIKLESFMAPSNPLLHNGEPTTSQGCNQATSEGLKHKLA